MLIAANRKDLPQTRTKHPFLAWPSKLTPHVECEAPSITRSSSKLGADRFRRAVTSFEDKPRSSVATVRPRARLFIVYLVTMRESESFGFVVSDAGLLSPGFCLPLDMRRSLFVLHEKVPHTGDT
jgi:hypothetical protein